MTWRALYISLYEGDTFNYGNKAALALWGLEWWGGAKPKPV